MKTPNPQPLQRFASTGPLRVWSRQPGVADQKSLGKERTMKHDMDLVRSLLMRIEESSGTFLRVNGEEPKHIELMEDAGLVGAHFVRTDGQGVIGAKHRKAYLVWS